MSKSLLFYVIDERTDDVKYCKMKGLRPYKTRMKTLDNNSLEQVVQYIKDDFIYDVLECDQFYSDYMIILMRLPKLLYRELLNIALSSKSFDERAGSIGVILKDYPIEFEKYLSSIKDMEFNDLGEKKNVRRMVKFIYDFIHDSCYIRQLENIMALCEELKLRLK